ncbi:MAG TPA: response regulator [Candidatus Hydrogenedentes bacterium]|mgnify:CR=1 FL=1|jgi:DNA-binding NtrC family response regulator|nr:response regulator [Candidatus Hydrogenedentota bacterium]MDY0031313.1 response regulator [FCB group bacterium]NLT61663.1 response regulator [Candidatus Hydrogenedentota bacterium]HNV22317.1 response regulator [Candidatus Hydrogenedentota bacterium]HNZ17951.1 response regulator [Candidatus Hydrogenedentota bacterium]
MTTKSVLVVDDEKNIRQTLAQALVPMGLHVETAVNGEEALQKVRDAEFDLMLLDLKMPGVDGMEVLRSLSDVRPEIRIIIITAYGTVKNAVEAIKLGAVDFIEKPFSPREIRELVNSVLARDTLEPSALHGYDAHIQWSKRCIQERRFPSAEEHVRKAIGLDASRAEAFNLLGALQELRGDGLGAAKSYRAAYALDPTYKPARINLERIAAIPRSSGTISLDNQEEL